MARDHALLVRVRRSIRALNVALERGSKAAGLTVQQQAFLLSADARGGRRVPLSELRADLGMDRATMSELLSRVVRNRLVRTSEGRDRRSIEVTLTPAGLTRFRRSVRTIRRAIRAADASGELRALRRNLRDYLSFYTD